MLLLNLLDLIKSTRVAQHFRVFTKCLSMDRFEILNLQNDKLKKLLIHAYETVPYYRQVFNEKAFDPFKLFGVNDLKLLPVLTRDHIQQHNGLMLSSSFDKKVLLKGSSSGTTGIPISYYMDKEAESAGIAAGYVLWTMSGWKFAERSVHIWGNQTSVIRWNTLQSKLKNFLINQKNIPSTLLNEPEGIRQVADEVIRFQPVNIDGYSSSIYTLANYFKENNISLKSVRRVLTTAENLEPHQQSLIKEIFALVGDLYGSGEVLGVASKPAGDTRYYILDPHVIVETVESGIDGMYEILLTDLDNYAMPLIRYKIGDMTDEILPPEQGAKYPFHWFTKIHGRNSDIITLPNGKKFHPVNIFGGTLFRRFNNITRHKTIWDGKTLEFVFEAKSFHEKESLHAALKQLLVPYQCDFIFTFTDRIEPSPSGKYKYMEILKPEISENDEGAVC